MRFLPLLVLCGLGVFAGFWWLNAQLPGDRPEGGRDARISTGGKWVALAGDRVQFDAIILQLDGVSCPKVQTEAGAAAQLALTEMMQAGPLDCQVLDVKTARCVVAGRDLGEAMAQSEMCQRLP